MPRTDLSPDELAFDAWLSSQPRRVRQRYAKAGIRLYRDQPKPDNVFPVKETHPVFGSEPNDPEPLEESATRFISEHELRPRICSIFEVVAKYADKRTAQYLLFVRSLLGEQTGVTPGSMAKAFGVTPQCMNYRARQILAALNALSKPDANLPPPLPSQAPSTPAWYKPRATRDTHDDEL